MTGTTPWQAIDNVEPIQADTIAALANRALFNVIAGCAATYSGVNLQVTIAAGAVTHNGTVTAVAGNVVTLVADPSLPRWAYIYIDNTGTAQIISGSPSATPAVPDTGANPAVALVYVQAALTVASNASYKNDKRVLTLTVVKYKSDDQTFTTSTAFADVTASAGTMSVPIGASERWLIEYWVPLAFGGTGGAKWQLTGPASPTAVSITGFITAYIHTDTNSDRSDYEVFNLISTTAFSTPFATLNSSAAATSNTLNAGGVPVAVFRALIVNGVNAGSVVLEAAQNSSDSTTTLGIGASMRATRVG